MGHKKHHKNHICSLDLGSDSMLPKKRPWTSLCRAVRKKWYVSELHPDAYRVFRSYPTLVAERQRQISEGGICVVHPLSSCSLFWNSFMALVNLSHMVLSSLRLSFVLHPLGHAPELHLVDYLLLALDLVCMVDILVKFHTGYVQGNANVVLNKLQIACHYLKSLFLVDLISSLPISYTLLFFEIDNPPYIFFGHLIAILKALSLCRDINNIITFLKTFHASYMVYGTVQNLILFILSAHWCSCINCIPVISRYYWTGQCPSMYLQYLTQNSSDLPNIPMAHRYKKAIFVSVSAFFGTGFSMYKQYHAGEVFLHSLTILYAALFMVYILVYFIKVYLTRHNSVIRYHELMNQLQNYMRHKQFPASLKKRVIAFYYYRYQGSYFREDIVFESLSEQLGNEIALHTCHKLVNKVSLFAGLPASVVGSVLGCLRPEVYLPNDLLVRAGDKGDCMYFIANGTVAVYSLKGVEVCHLEDGAHFGEVALLMKDSKRVATVVAVEITQVYRLDAAHFRHFIETYQVLHERIEALASQRMHETVLLDEAFKHEREKFQEQNIGSTQNLDPSPNPSAQNPK